MFGFKGGVIGIFDRGKRGIPFVCKGRRKNRVPQGKKGGTKNKSFVAALKGGSSHRGQGKKRVPKESRPE